MTAKWIGGAAAALLGVVAVTPAADQKDVSATIIGARDLTVFAVAVREAGLVDVLRGPGPVTVFAPTDAAFDKLGDDTIKSLVKDKARLKELMAAHFVRGRAVYTRDLVALGGKELNGFPVAAGKDALTIGPAKVTRADVACSNGVIHVLDAVLVPPVRKAD